MKNGIKQGLLLGCAVSVRLWWGSPLRRRGRWSRAAPQHKHDRDGRRDALEDRDHPCDRRGVGNRPRRADLLGQDVRRWKDRAQGAAGHDGVRQAEGRRQDRRRVRRVNRARHAAEGDEAVHDDEGAAIPGATGMQMSVSAEIVSVDTLHNKVTFKGPKGKIKTVAVQSRGPAVAAAEPEAGRCPRVSVHRGPGHRDPARSK